MNWKVKALLQRTISILPASEGINYLFQKHISRNLPVNDKTLEEKIVLAAKRVEMYGRFSTKPLEEGVFYEFGAGWDLIGPLATFALGVNKQILLDISPHVRFELINNALRRIAEKNKYFSSRSGKELRLFPVNQVNSVAEIDRNFGIEYKAPADARATALPEASVDHISTNSTLEHIPEEALQQIMQESYRILRPGGIMHHYIDLKDQFTYFDSSLSKYNFLRYSPARWRVFNSSLQYQNRLRYPDYRRMIKQAGFEILLEELVHATDEEIRAFRKLPLHGAYRDLYSEQELTVQLYRIVARKSKIIN